MSGLDDLDALVSGPSSSAAKSPSSGGAGGNVPADAGPENNPSSDGATYAAPAGGGVPEEMPSLARAAPVPAAPSSPTLAARRPRLSSLGSSLRCRIQIKREQLSILGGQAALSRFEERGGILYCTAEAEGNSKYWNYVQVCNSCHIAGRQYQQSLRETTSAAKKAAQDSSSSSSSSSSLASSLTPSSSSALSAEQAKKQEMYLKRREQFREMRFFLQCYLSFFQNETLQQGPDPLAYMKKVCQRIFLNMKRGKITKLEHLGMILRKFTLQALPQKPGLYQILVSKVVSKLNEQRKKHAQKKKEGQQEIQKKKKEKKKKETSEQEQGAQKATPQKDEGLSAGTSGNDSPSSPPAPPSPKTSENDSPSPPQPPPPPKKTQWELEFGMKKNEFFLKVDDIDDMQDVLGCMSSFPSNICSETEESREQMGEGTSSTKQDGSNEESWVSDGAYALSESGEYELMIEQAQPSVETLRLYKKLASKESRLPRSWKDNSIIPLSALHQRVVAACKSAPIPVAIESNKTSFEREKGIGHLLKRAIDHMVKETLEGICNMNNHRHASRDTFSKAQEPGNQEAPKRRSRKRARDGSTSALDVTASGGHVEGAADSIGGSVFGGISDRSELEDFLAAESLKVYKIQVDKQQKYMPGIRTDKQKNPVSYLRWKHEDDQEKARGELKQKIKQVQAEAVPNSMAIGPVGEKSSASGFDNVGGGGNNAEFSRESELTTMNDILDATLRERANKRNMNIFEESSFVCDAISKTDFPDVPAPEEEPRGGRRRRKSMRVARAAATVAPTVPLQLITVEDLKTYTARSGNKSMFSGSVVADLFCR